MPRKDTELAVGDLITWRTPHGTLLIWVFATRAQKDGRWPVVEVLEWIGDEIPPHTERLEAHRGRGAIAGHSNTWFHALHLRDAVDPKGRYAVVRRGFARASFVPSKASEYGLGATIVDALKLTESLERIAAKMRGVAKEEPKVTRLEGAAIDLAAIDLATTELYLTGPMPLLAPLSRLVHLEKLLFSRNYDLSTLPQLASWPKLRWLILQDVRKRDADRIVKEAAAMPNLDVQVIAPRTDAFIAKPRPRFTWSSKSARGASAAFATMQTALAKLHAPSAKNAKPIVDAFVGALNALHAKKGTALFTLEREDIVSAVHDAFSGEKLVGLREAALRWLDARREF